MQFPKFSLRLVLGLSALLCVSGSVSAQRAIQNDFKKLAGPADEVNAMRLPDPATLGTRSKTAMIAFRGTGKMISVPVETSENLRVTIISPNAKDLGLNVALPGERLERAAAIDSEESTFGFDGAQYPARTFTLGAVKSGRLAVTIDGSNALRGTNNSRDERGFVVISSDSPYQVYSYIDRLNTITGGQIGFVASVFNHDENSAEGIPVSTMGAARSGQVTITRPDGSVSTIEMSGGRDGIFRASFVPASTGRHIVQMTVQGVTRSGEEFLRTSEHVFEAEKGVRIGNSAGAQMIDELRWQIDLPVEGASAGNKVLAHGEVWGIDAAGNAQNIGWIGGMSVAERGGRRGVNVPLSLDSRWLVGSSAVSYELRNVRVQDPDSMVVLGEQTQIGLPHIYPTETASRTFRGEITDDMRMGKRPESPVVSEAAGGKLMLVHGYCSGDGWPQTAQFTNFVKFADYNKNRTHDQFANLIKNFGASLPSFGIVAHSQGGAASLHLYTYYWSGLDSATGGSRLIQSVGTPYQGTALAGNLAAIGSVFGAGCGTNNNLTYSGSASWLAGIPSWARAKVSYSTTSFTDVWYRYDYCNIATDLFLSDPDDGVVERAYAQLSGGINMGHKTGWCHTTGMRDPGQTTDSSRNSNMNANAAR